MTNSTGVFTWQCYNAALLAGTVLAEAVKLTFCGTAFNCEP